MVSREDPFEARENAKVLSPGVDEDDDSPMHTLTLELIESLQKHLPVAKRGESFWLRYSLIRDGASLDLLLRNVQDSDYTVMVVETVDGDDSVVELVDMLAASRTVDANPGDDEDGIEGLNLFLPLALLLGVSFS